MTAARSGRYSKFIRPVNTTFDLLVINLFSLFFFRELKMDLSPYLIYQSAGWIIIAYYVRFYDVYRFTNPVDLIAKIFRQAVVFFLVVIAFFPFQKQVIFSGSAIAAFVATAFLVITAFKFLMFYYLQHYRVVSGSNYKKAIIVGHTPEAVHLKELFESKQEYGYRFLGFFSDRKTSAGVAGRLADLKDFVLENAVDEIYCSLSEVTNDQLKNLVDFADDHQKLVKFIPDTKAIFSKNLKVDYYEVFPVLSLQKTALHDPYIKIFKRAFDIFFSLFVVVGLLSWLAPILAILIKLESRGPVFFKQGRPGLDEKNFNCYKFRSMRINSTTEREASKNDPRVTRIGRFIRKTSLDETPQFFNVLLGDMSVVGPRPHLWSQNKAYGNKIKKYMVRHYVKPGITGLAQVRGYRGEIETDEDMVNRIKFDVYYIENWSLILDIKIILQTVVNIFRGEEKAY